MNRGFRPQYRFQPRPVVTPPPGFSDSEDLKLTQEGVWLADGVEISHSRMCQLFFRSLFCDDAGYYLHVGREVKAVDVEDTAYFVVSLSGDPTFGFWLELSDGTREELNLSSLLYEPGRLLVDIKAQGERARFLRHPYHELLASGEETPNGVRLISGHQTRVL